MIVVETRGVHFSYGDRQVLKNVSIRVGRGEFFVVIGPNGSGKTTLLKIIAGLFKPARGEVDLLGRGMATYSRRKISQRVAIVPQQAPVDFPFSVADTVLMGRAPHLGALRVEGAGDRRIARQAMEFTAVEHLAGRYLDQLSGGERQRVMIARAICQQPDLIVLDEPTASLDLAHQLRVLDLMERLRRESAVTVVMVSHDLNLAALYGDRLLLLKDGEVVAGGRPQEVLQEERLRQVYGCAVLVDRLPGCGSPRVTPLPDRYAALPKD